MTTPLRVSQTHTYPLPVDEVFAKTLPLPLERFFSKRFGPIPPIKGTTQDGVWGVVGQVRTVHTADGGSMREELVTVDPPNEFAYVLTQITGPMKPLVHHVEGTWAFATVGTGSSITWSWVVHPSSVGRAAMPVFGWFWNGYARRALDRLEGLLLAG